MSQITTLIDKQDNVELIRDEIASILAVEQQNQQALATADGQDPDLWKLRVYRERSNPWAEFQPAPESPVDDVSPIVNVWFDTESFDESRSNTVRNQHATATYNIDCYGYAKSESDPGGGHKPGDREAALVSQRAARLCRNILMAGHYTYLGMRGVVWKRFPRSIETFQVPIDNRNAIKVVDTRLALLVQFSEFSPQVEPVELELLSVTVRFEED